MTHLEKTQRPSPATRDLRRLNHQPLNILFFIFNKEFMLQMTLQLIIQDFCSVSLELLCTGLLRGSPTLPQSSNTPSQPCLFPVPNACLTPQDCQPFPRHLTLQDSLRAHLPGITSYFPGSSKPVPLPRPCRVASTLGVHLLIRPSDQSGPGPRAWRCSRPLHSRLSSCQALRAGSQKLALHGHLGLPGPTRHAGGP